MKFSDMLIIAVTGSFLYVYWIEPWLEKPSLMSASNYEVITFSDISFPGRKRLSYTVSSFASTDKVIKETAQKAAFDLQKTTGSHVIQICLTTPSDHETCIASIAYARDGRGYSGDQDWKWNFHVLPEFLSAFDKKRQNEIITIPMPDNPTMTTWDQF